MTTVDADDSRDLSLAYRVRVANQYNSKETIFISIHSNAFNTKAKGFEIYTSKGVTQSDFLAESIANQIEPFLQRIKIKTQI